ncbi:unspecified product, partial [Leptomonas pyrrhocoris]
MILRPLLFLLYLGYVVVLLQRIGNRFFPGLRGPRWWEQTLQFFGRLPLLWRQRLQRFSSAFERVSFTCHIALVSYLFVFFVSSNPCMLRGFYRDPPRNELYTHNEVRTNTPTAPSLTSPAHDPRLLSPFPPRSALTAAFFCGRPTASSYDGYAGAAHAAYIHHDMDHDRFVVRTFGRGGTRVDLRRRTGIGRSTYEVFCGASVHAQTRTPLAPSQHYSGEDNWLNNPLLSAGTSSNDHHRLNVDFAVKKLAVPHASPEAADPFDADFTKADQGLRTHYRRYSRDEVLAKNRHMDFIYSYVNGSDVTRLFLKPFARESECSMRIAAVKLLWAELQRNTRAAVVTEGEFSSRMTALLFAAPTGACSVEKILSSSWTTYAALFQFRSSLVHAVARALQRNETPHRTFTNADLLATLESVFGTQLADDIDADSDELRHSMRGLLQHTRDWHRGRLSVVTPYANVPQWLNQSKGFFLRSLLADLHAQGGAGDDGPLGTADVAYVREAHTAQLHYTRVHVVDQRALMPPAPLTTVNSFVIEPFIYRLRNISAVFTFLNDDYLIMRDVDVAEFVNAYGGPVLRIEHVVAASMLHKLPRGEFWSGLAYNFLLLNRDLDRLPADHDEFIQPTVFAASKHQDGSKSNELRRGVLRTDWAAFTAAVEVRVGEHCRLDDVSRCAAQQTSSPFASWLACADGDARGQQSCRLPRVSRREGRSWTVDAAGTFARERRPPSQLYWRGAVQLPSLARWGDRVVERVVDDVIEQQPFIPASQPVDVAAAPTVETPVDRDNAIMTSVNAVRLTLEELRSSTVTARDVPPPDLRAHVERFAEILMSSELPRDKMRRTPPRLRKYRLRLDSHAPYVQCRNMWKYIHTRYAPDLNENMLLSTSRAVTDFLPPSTHTAHLLRHPWAGSSQYIPYLMAKEAWRLQAAGEEAPRSANEPPLFPVVDVALDNEDGCAPATYVGDALGDQRYNHFTDKERENNATKAAIRGYVDKVAFTNINSKFTKPEVGVVLRNFLEELFPTPMLLENGWQNGTDEPRVLLDVDGGNRTVSDPAYTLHHLRTAFHRLMRLPLILVSNDEEGFCPLLRSLRHAMPAFRGLRVVQVLVPPADGRSLYAARAAQRHAYRNFLPVTRCTLPPGRLTRVTLPAHSSTADAIVAGLRSAREGLEAEDWAAPALVALRGR